MFRENLRPSSGGRTAFHCLWFSVLFIVVMLESRVVRFVHCDEDAAWLSSITTINRTENHRQWNSVRPPDDGRKDARNMLRNNWLRINDYLLHLIGLTFIYAFLVLFAVTETELLNNTSIPIRIIYFPKVCDSKHTSIIFCLSFEIHFLYTMFMYSCYWHNFSIYVSRFVKAVGSSEHGPPELRLGADRS
jgi:hypothetical protein